MSSRQIPSALALIALTALAIPPSGCALRSWFTSTSSEFRAPDPEHLDARIAIEGEEPNGQVDHFAVLIGGDTELRHRGNLSMAYQVLIEQGYRPEDVYIFDSEGDTPFFPVTDMTTRAAIARVFEHLARIVEPKDTLFVYVTGHGRRIKAEEQAEGKAGELGVSTLVLNPGEELSQDELTALLEKVSPEAGIAFFDQCYWGQVSSARLCNYVVVTTSQPGETSNGVSFPRAFWGAFRERRDDVRSIFDAFKIAMVADRATALGLNKPRISHSCVNPADVNILGILRGHASPP